MHFTVLLLLLMMDVMWAYIGQNMRKIVYSECGNGSFSLNYNTEESQDQWSDYVELRAGRRNVVSSEHRPHGTYAE